MTASSSNAAPSEPRAPRLLVVEDDREVAALLTRYLSGQGFEVLTAGDGPHMRAVLAEQSIDLVLLDLGLPGEDGLELTRHLREHWRGAVIIVTGRADSVDRIVGLEMGADDYVTKPFDLRELLARIRSVLRRSQERARTAPAEPQPPTQGVFHFAGFRLDPRARTLKAPTGEDVPLTTGEFELLRVFIERPNRVLSRDDLMSLTHGRDASPFDRAVDVQIGRLRRKIEPDPSQPALIKSVRGAGYIFAEPVRRQ